MYEQHLKVDKKWMVSGNTVNNGTVSRDCMQTIETLLIFFIKKVAINNLFRELFLTYCTQKLIKAFSNYQQNNLVLSIRNIRTLSL